MSVEQVKAFLAKVKADSSLSQKLKDAQDAYTGDTSDKDAAVAAIVIPVAAQAGFTFTVDDFKAAFEAEGEASSDELNAVAGGVDYLTYFICYDPQAAAQHMYCSAHAIF